MKLQSMTDFVLKMNTGDGSCSYRFSLIQRYAKFLKQPLTLGMFVPCDEDGNVLEEPGYNDSSDNYYSYQQYKSDMYEYKQAKDRVLFEFKPFPLDFKNASHIIEYYDMKTIEDILEYAEPELTPTAIKQLGL